MQEQFWRWNPIMTENNDVCKYSLAGLLICILWVSLLCQGCDTSKWYVKYFVSDHSTRSMQKIKDLWKCARIGFVGFRNYADYDGKDSVPYQLMELNPDKNRLLNLVSSSVRQRLYHRMRQLWSEDPEILAMSSRRNYDAVLSKIRYLEPKKDVRYVEDIPVHGKVEVKNRNRIQTIIDQYVQINGLSGLYDMSLLFEVDEKASKSPTMGAILEKDRDLDYYVIGYTLNYNYTDYISSLGDCVYCLPQSGLMEAFPFSMLWNPSMGLWLVSFLTIPMYIPDNGAMTVIKIYDKDWNFVANYSDQWEYAYSESRLYKEGYETSNFKSSYFWHKNPQPFAEKFAKEFTANLTEFRKKNCSGDWKAKLNAF